MAKKLKHYQGDRSFSCQVENNSFLLQKASSPDKLVEMENVQINIANGEMTNILSDTSIRNRIPPPHRPLFLFCKNIQNTIYCAIYQVILTPSTHS